MKSRNSAILRDADDLRPLKVSLIETAVVDSLE